MARYGMELGYQVTLIKDATATFNPEGMEAARANSLVYANAILTTNELLAGFLSSLMAGRQSCSQAEKLLVSI